MTKPDFSFERKLWQRGFRAVAGVDEVGRGAFAGPIVAAAVVFPVTGPAPDAGINDSKQLKPRQREKLAEFIKQNALSWGIGEIGPRIINKLGMARATKMTFRSAIAAANLKLKAKSAKVDFLLIDAFYIPYVRGLPVGKHARKGRHSADPRARQKPVTHGDQKSVSIAAASILAKVYRDKLMQSLGKQAKFKNYGWGRNKGYGTREHQGAIKRYGITRLHRKVFVETWRNKVKAKKSKVKSETQNLKLLRFAL